MYPYKLQVQFGKKKGKRRRKRRHQSGAGLFDMLKKGAKMLTSDKAKKMLKYARKGVDYAAKGQDFLNNYVGQSGGYRRRRRTKKRQTYKLNRNQHGAGLFKLSYNVLKDI